MVMLNDLDRFHLVIDVIDRVEGLANRAAALRQRMLDARLAAPPLHARARRGRPRHLGLDVGLRATARTRSPQDTLSKNR